MPEIFERKSKRDTMIEPTDDFNAGFQVSFNSDNKLVFRWYALDKEGKQTGKDLLICFTYLETKIIMEFIKNLNVKMI